MISKGKEKKYFDEEKETNIKLGFITKFHKWQNS